jgi:hypothetical protein
MIRLRHSATLLLITAFAVFQLLATAPLFHSSHCETVETLAQAKHQREAPTFRDGGGVTLEGADECPVCMLSGLAAILSPGLAVFAPADHLAALHPTPDGDVRASVGENLRSRGPPSA